MSQNSSEILTVDVESAKKDAYVMGFERFEASDGVDDPQLSYFTSGAQFINVISKELKLMSGFADNSPMAPTSREVRVDGETVEAHYLYEEVRDAWEMGAYDALRGDDKDVSRAKDV